MLSDEVERKIIESLDVNDWQIETEDGWKDITHIHKTVEYEVYELITETHSLKCADNHIVMVKGFKEKFVKDLTKRDKVITDNGLEKVISVKKLKIPTENMYDVTVDSDTHTLFTNGILSHNTTVTTIFLLWFALFNKDKTIAIIANKEDIAKEILKRIKTAYENLPLWIQVGLKDGGWAEKKIELGNGSRLVAASTSPSSISGLSVSLLFIDEFAKIDRSKQEEFITATYPVISAGKKSKIIIVSTPLGVHNVFYEFWSKAVRGLNNFFPIKVSWKDHPERDMEWKRKVLADIGPVRFRQEYECSDGNTLITVKDKITNKIIKITIEDFYNKYLN